MAKRFTDTDKWKKPFIRGLEAKYKLLWFYILDDCDHAGLWIVDLEIASIRCGFEYSEKDVLDAIGEQIEIIKGGQIWFIRDFIDFQYGVLNESNRAHNSVLNILKKNKIKPLISPLEGVKDKDKDKDLDKDYDNNIGDVDFFELFWQLYKKGTNRVPAQRAWADIDNAEYPKIIEHVPKYVEATPEYRKDAVNYLKDRNWLDSELPNYTKEKPKPKPYKIKVPL